jgi:hypothetical protein
MAITSLRKKQDPVTADHVAQEVAVPSLEDFSDYRNLTEKRSALQQQLSVTQKKIDATSERIRSGKFITEDEHASKLRIASILGDAAPDDATIDRVELKRLCAEIQDIEAALKVLETRISSERMRASAAICEQVKAEHARLVTDQCEKLIALVESARAYEMFTGALNAGDIAWTSLIPMFMQWQGRASDGQGKPAHFLREAVKEGFIPAEALPLRLRGGGGVGPGRA